MGIGTFILGKLGNSLDKQYRGEFKRLTSSIYATAPISAVETMLGFYSHGAITEFGVFQGLTREVATSHASANEAEMHRAFADAKTAGSGTRADRDARMVAVKLSDIFADAAPIEMVAAYIEAIKEVQNRNFKTDYLSEDLLTLGCQRAAARSPYLQDKFAKL